MDTRGRAEALANQVTYPCHGGMVASLVLLPTTADWLMMEKAIYYLVQP